MQHLHVYPHTTLNAMLQFSLKLLFYGTTKEQPSLRHIVHLLTHTHTHTVGLGCQFVSCQQLQWERGHFRRLARVLCVCVCVCVLLHTHRAAVH